jgi:hypothetical protein
MVIVGQRGREAFVLSVSAELEALLAGDQWTAGRCRIRHG